MRPLNIARDGALLFRPSEAKHDKIFVNFPVIIPITHHQAPAYVEAVTNQDASGPDILQLRYHQSDGSLSVATSDQWHFGLTGKLLPETGRYAGTLKLALNPTRFLAHQHSANPEELEGLAALDLLAINGDRSTELCACTLDGKDNILVSRPDAAPQTAFLGTERFNARAQWWRAILQLYVDRVQELIQQSLSPPTMPLPAFTADYGALRQCEVYWELSTVLAPVILRDFVAAVKRMDPEATATSLTTTDGGDANSTWVAISPRQSIRVVIYAKTMDRVRVEVRYLTNISGVLSDLNNAHASLDISAQLPLVDKLMALPMDASPRTTQFWNGARQQFGVPDDAADIVEFLSAINERVPEENRMALIALLAARGCLSQTSDDGIAPMRLIRSLVRAEVLSRNTLRSRSGTAFLHRRYRAVFRRVFPASGL